MNLFRVAIATALAVSTMPPVMALEAAEPGKSLWGISLGTSRAKAIAAAKTRWPNAKRQKSYSFKNGLTDDEWIIPIGTEESRFEILSKGGKIVQLRTWSSGERGQTNLSFAKLIKRHRLQKRVYGFEFPDGGGYVEFFYDDVKRGVCFAASVQDDFILTSTPDSIIVHRPGVPVIAITGGVTGKKVTGRAARAFSSLEEARRVEQFERNDY